MSATQKNIQDYADLPALLDSYRASGKKIVLTQGSFDLIHIGHGRYLEKAKKYGNITLIPLFYIYYIGHIINGIFLGII